MNDHRGVEGTPLSDRIAAHTESGSPETWARFLDTFRRSQVGVVAVGVPAGTSGGFVSTADRPVSVGLTKHAGGQSMALAFADPEAFAARFGQPFNAGMTGEALLATAILNPDCAGILVNSALAEVSMVIDRATLEGMLRPAVDRPDAKSKSWWRFW